MQSKILQYLSIIQIFFEKIVFFSQPSFMYVGETLHCGAKCNLGLCSPYEIVLVSPMETVNISLFTRSTMHILEKKDVLTFLEKHNSFFYFLMQLE